MRDNLMHLRTALLTLLVGSTVVLGNVPQTIASIDAAFQQGAISLDKKILNKIYLIYDQGKMDPQFRPAQPEWMRCGTPIIIEYEREKTSLRPGTISEIEHYLNPDPSPAIRSIYDSPGGHFRLTYSTTGANAVPAADNDFSGVPDYVEWAAQYLEHTWEMEIDSAGFAGPNLTGGDGLYNISFQNMQAYGVTTTSGVDGNEQTRLTLHNNFIGFGSNQDPEGNVKGAMKVTSAHEFKHASQYVHSHWSEGGWVELDATWAEEFVYDYVNDSMLNFMGFQDPFSNPNYSLDHGGTGSYEDYPWEDFIHQRFGGNSYTQAPFLFYFWTWRETHTYQSVLSSYEQLFTGNGENFASAFKEYVVWNYFTGNRAVTTSFGQSLFGYDEAGITGFPTATLSATHTTYPVNVNGSPFEHLAGRMIRLLPPTGLRDGLEIQFNGQDGVALSAMWAVRFPDSVSWGEIPLDNANNGSFVLDLRGASEAALIPVVTQTSGSNFTFSYSINSTIIAECSPGDINADGALDVTDLVRLVNIILEQGEPPTPVEICAGDVNEDEAITVQDVVQLVNIILQ